MSESRKYIEYGKILDKGFRDGLNETHEANKMSEMLVYLSEQDMRNLELGNKIRMPVNPNLDYSNLQEIIICKDSYTQLCQTKKPRKNFRGFNFINESKCIFLKHSRCIFLQS